MIKTGFGPFFFVFFYSLGAMGEKADILTRCVFCFFPWAGDSENQKLERGYQDARITLQAYHLKAFR